LALMVDSVFAEPPQPAIPKESWRAALARWAREHLRVLRIHSWVVRVPISGPPVLPNQVLWFERGIGSMRGTQLKERDKVGILLLINGFVRNQALFESDIQNAMHAASTSSDKSWLDYGKLLARLIDPQRFPALDALLKAGVFDVSTAPEDPDEDFN